MAVSQMQKLSLILPKDDLDGLLLALQSEAKIQIYDLSEHEEWQAAFEANTLSQPLTEDKRQALVELQKRQEQVEKMIQTLEPYMPEKKALQALKEEPLSLSFDDLQAHGMIRDEDLQLTKVKRQLRVLDKARQKIADAKGEIERLEKWRPLEVTPAALATFHYVHGLIGTIPKSDTDAVRSSLKAHPELELEEVFTSETEHGYVILYRSGDRVAVQELLEDHGFKELDYEEEQVPAAYLDRLEGEIKEQEAALRLECCGSHVPEIDIADVFRQLFEDKADSVTEEEIADLAKMFRAISIEELSLFPGVSEMLQRLKDAG